MNKGILKDHFAESIYLSDLEAVSHARYTSQCHHACLETHDSEQHKGNDDGAALGLKLSSYKLAQTVPNAHTLR